MLNSKFDTTIKNREEQQTQDEHTSVDRHHKIRRNRLAISASNPAFLSVTDTPLNLKRVFGNVNSKAYKGKVFLVLGITLIMVLLSATFGYRVLDKMELLKTEWQTFNGQSADQAKLLYQIKTNLGYGGFIHLFNNYILFKDPTLIPAIEESIANLQHALDSYDNYLLSTPEQEALVVLQQTLSDYERHYAMARELIISGVTTDELSRAVQQDERAAVDALATLSTAINKREQQYNATTSQHFVETQGLIRWGVLLLPVMLISACVLIFLLHRILKIEHQMKRMAHYDMLTALPNRLLFHDRLQQAIIRAQRHDSIAALMFIDLDGFKKINDSFGHKSGDKLLRHIARQLQLNMRQSDTVARIGGDEFTVIAENLASAEQAELIAEKLLKAIETPVRMGNQTIQVSASIGISICPRDTNNETLLMHYADLAMYKAKNSNSRHIYRYHSTLADSIYLA